MVTTPQHHGTKESFKIWPNYLAIALVVAPSTGYENPIYYLEVINKSMHH